MKVGYARHSRLAVVRGLAQDIPLKDQTVDCVVTSPSYWGVRPPYGTHAHEIGPESLDDYLTHAVWWLIEVDRVLKKTGTLWLNLGDTASGSGGAGGDYNAGGSKAGLDKWKQGPSGLPKGTWCMVPQRIASLMLDQGWFIRKWITWDQMQDRREDEAHIKRPKVSSETIIMATKSPPGKYVYHPHRAEVDKHQGEDGRKDTGDVWHFPPMKGKRMHLAPFPAELPRRCILRSTNPGDVVLDPFSGSGTTPKVANSMGRRGIGIDLYAGMPNLAVSE